MPHPHEIIVVAMERRLVQRKRLAGISASILLALFAGSITLCSSCQSVPTEVLGGGSGDGGGYEQLVEDAAALYAQQPRNEERLRQSVEKYGKAAAQRTDDYEMLIGAARSYIWLAAYLPDSGERVKFAKEGLKYTSTAVKQRPEGIQGLFYHAVLSGLLGDADHSYGLDAVGIIERNCKKIIESGKDIDHGGAHRVFGALLAEAPGPPTSIGSLRNARKQLEQALEKAPEWPENHLWMALIELKNAKEKGKAEDARKARERLDKHLLGPDARAPETHQHEFTQWQKQARDWLEKLK